MSRQTTWFCAHIIYEITTLLKTDGKFSCVTSLKVALKLGMARLRSTIQLIQKQEFMESLLLRFTYERLLCKILVLFQLYFCKFLTNKLIIPAYRSSNFCDTVLLYVLVLYLIIRLYGLFLQMILVTSCCGSNTIKPI